MSGHRASVAPPRRRGERDVLGREVVRRSHIFAAAVREVLELDLLREVSSLPLTLSQFHLLKLMTFNGLHHVGEVADFLGVSPPAATKNVDKLERLGLVERQPAAGDRRALLITVLPAGRRLVEKYEEIKGARLNEVLAGFSADEIETFNELLQRFSVSLLARRDAGQSICLRCSAYIKSGCPVGEVRGGCPYIRIRGQHARMPSTQTSTSRSA